MVVWRKGFRPDDGFDIQQIVAESNHRWLRSDEIWKILQNHEKLHISTQPANMPPSGSLFLFDRKVLRYFRKDGHKWRKKKDGKTVAEGNEKLRVGGKEMLRCYYTYGEENENFKRRFYYMLKEFRGDRSDIVLVHYLVATDKESSGGSKKKFEVGSSSNSKNVEEGNIVRPHEGGGGGGGKLKEAQNGNLLGPESAYHQASFRLQPVLESRQLQAVDENLNDELYNSWMSTELEAVDEPYHQASFQLQPPLEEQQHNLDIFEPWMSTVLEDSDKLQMQPSTGDYGNTVESENEVHMSSAPLQVHLDSNMLGPSHSCDQLYCIAEFAPNWAFENSYTKVVITGRFSKNEQAESCKWFCVFGEAEVTAEVKGAGGLCCFTPVHRAGRFPFYVTCSHKMACSEVKEFEFRVNDRDCRERMVAWPFSLGVAPGALTDPTTKYPTGETPADLGSEQGIAGYLAESGLSAYLSSLNLDSKEGSSAEISGAKAVSASSRDGELTDGISLIAVSASDERALSLIAVKSHKEGKRDEHVAAAAVRIQNKFRSWKGRKDFLIIRQRIIKIQAHVRGHQVRKIYRKIDWSVGIVEKIMRWRLKACGWLGFKPEPLPEDPSMQVSSSKDDDYDLLKEGRKQTEQKALGRVKSMVLYPEGRDQYHPLLNVVAEIQVTKTSEGTLSCSSNWPMNQSLHSNREYDVTTRFHEEGDTADLLESIGPFQMDSDMQTQTNTDTISKRNDTIERKADHPSAIKPQLDDDLFTDGLMLDPVMQWTNAELEDLDKPQMQSNTGANRNTVESENEVEAKDFEYQDDRTSMYCPDAYNFGGFARGVSGDVLTGVRGSVLTGIRDNVINVHGDVKNVRGNVINIHGNVKNVRGNVNVDGNVKNVRGNVNVDGNVKYVNIVTGVHGDVVTGVHGDVINVRGDVFKDQVSMANACETPTKHPTGETPADLASEQGHKRIAGYLAESALSARLSSLNLDSKEGNSAEIPGAKAVSHIAVSLSRDGESTDGISHTAVSASDELALSLIAVKSHKAGKRDEHVDAAAVRIQNKFRSWKGRKDFLPDHQNSGPCKRSPGEENI